MQNSENRIRIVVVSEHALIRDAWIISLERVSGFEVVGEARDCAESAATIRRECADIALVDIDLTDPSSPSVVRGLRTSCPETRLLILTSQLDPSVCRKAIQLGACGIFYKDQSFQSLVKAIKKVHEGEIWMDRSVIASALSDFRNESPTNEIPGPGAASLTAREKEIIGLICEGLRNQEIADRLFISEKTVRNHLASIYSKLEVGHRLELAVIAKKYGLSAI